MVTFEEFERNILKLRDDALSGKLVPKDEDKIPRLIYGDLAEATSQG